MIDTLTGTVARVVGHSLILRVHGIAFTLQVPHGDKFQEGQEVAMVVYMHWNQENGPSLFGFATELERALFCMIIDCSGIGPKIALAVLVDLGPDRFIAAVHSGDEKELSSVSGIGAKKAEQMLVQLRHKVAKLIKSGVLITNTETPFAQWQELIQVLESLNYSKPEINSTLKHLRETYNQQEYAFDQLVRHALSFLAKKA